MDKIQIWMERLRDSRSKKVVFLSHCILNENTRYLGGACTGGCISEVVEPYVASGTGLVQMPCPEQRAWGGVTKRWLLMAYGTKGSLLDRFRSILLPLFLMNSRRIYRRLAQETSDQIKDYLISGYSVLGVMGIDGSPSCGVNKTLDFGKAFNLTAAIDIDSITVKEMNALIRQCVTDGPGLFTAALKEEFERRRINIPYLAHDLMAEIDGGIS